MLNNSCAYSQHSYTMSLTGVRLSCVSGVMHNTPFSELDFSQTYLCMAWKLTVEMQVRTHLSKKAYIPYKKIWTVYKNL